jgi:hypothetical protein
MMIALIDYCDANRRASQAMRDLETAEPATHDDDVMGVG